MRTRLVTVLLDDGGWMNLCVLASLTDAEIMLGYLGRRPPWATASQPLVVGIEFFPIGGP